MTLADARPELIWNQITGGSNTMHSIYTPVRVAAAIARGALLKAAAIELGVSQSQLTIRDGVVVAPNGATATFGSLSAKAAVSSTTTANAAAQAAVAAQARRHAAEARRRARHRHRAQALRDGAERPERQADDGLPAADDQRLCPGGPEPGPGQGHARHHRRRDHPAHAVRRGWGGSPGRDVRAVHRRHPRARRGVGCGPRRRQVRRQRARRPQEGRAPGAAAGEPAGQDARPALHVPLPPGRPARDQLRRGGRPAGRRRDLVEPQDADLGAGADRAQPRAAGRQGEGARGPGRRVLRAPSVRRRRLRGGRHLQGVRASP